MKNIIIILIEKFTFLKNKWVCDLPCWLVLFVRVIR